MLGILHILSTLQSVIFVSFIQYLILFGIGILKQEAVLAFSKTNTLLTIFLMVWCYAITMGILFFNEIDIFPDYNKDTEQVQLSLENETDEIKADTGVTTAENKIADTKKITYRKFLILIIYNLFSFTSMVLLVLLSLQTCFLLICANERGHEDCTMIWGDGLLTYYISAGVIIINMYNAHYMFLLTKQYSNFFNISYRRRNVLSFFFMALFNIFYIEYRNLHKITCKMGNKSDISVVKDYVLVFFVVFYELIFYVTYSISIRGDKKPMHIKLWEKLYTYHSIFIHIFNIIYFLISITAFIQAETDIIFLYFYLILGIFIVAFCVQDMSTSSILDVKKETENENLKTE